MRNKGCDNASTIHSLIYRARESGVEQPSFELWDDAPASKAKLIVIDECSMVDAELGRDLMSFECPLLVLGDPAQLPPIQGGGYFTDCEPDAMLTEVHRQAQDDPIIRMSMDVREGREFHLAVDAVGDVPRQRGLAGSGIAEQPEDRGRAVLAGFCLEPAGNGLQRGILMRCESWHGFSVERSCTERRLNGPQN